MESIGAFREILQGGAGAPKVIELTKARFGSLVPPDNERAMSAALQIMSEPRNHGHFAALARKRARDFSKADRIREELRLRGVDAETARPSLAPSACGAFRCLRISSPLPGAARCSVRRHHWNRARDSYRARAPCSVTDMLRPAQHEDQLVTPSHRKQRAGNPLWPTWPWALAR